MKKLVLALLVLLAAPLAIAQSVPAKIVNKTDCGMYVMLIEVNASCASQTQNVYVPAHSVIYATPIAGGEFEFALVTDTPSPYDYSCYYEKVQVPWASCISGYNSTEIDEPCCDSDAIVSTWALPYSTPATPQLYIYEN